ncbi:hypothetical protein KSP40_PGU009841 [Platanthera guangdongensis]|uniref:Uncharacterized protein n=1 Tax=Platanthera guangdongensis TaxID=2320717 RepID=A0ABR2LKA7_9ASPA
MKGCDGVFHMVSPIKEDPLQSYFFTSDFIIKGLCREHVSLYLWLVDVCADAAANRGGDKECDQGDIKNFY